MKEEQTMLTAAALLMAALLIACALIPPSAPGQAQSAL